MLKHLLGLGPALIALGGLVACGGSAPEPPPVTILQAFPTITSPIMDIGTVDNIANPHNTYGPGIYLLDPATGALHGWAISRNLENPDDMYVTSLHGASWSQARQELLIGTMSGDEPALFTVALDGKTTDLKLWADAEMGVEERYDFAWSPDGRQIAYNQQGRGNSGALDDVFVQDATGSPPRRITNGMDARNPSWSPDGAHIAFSTFTRNPQIYRVAVDGGTPQLLLGDFWTVYKPAWSPDGAHIAFLGKKVESEPVNLWVMDADGGGVRAVVSLPSPLDEVARSLSAFAWSPDSWRFVFLSDHAGPCYHNAIEGGGACESRLYRVNVDGSDLTKLSEHSQSSFDVWLAWLP
ncbi:MAG: hypothetical protein WCD37_08945 [Chloroflexia bacterium]